MLLLLLEVGLGDTQKKKKQGRGNSLPQRKGKSTRPKKRAVEQHERNNSASFEKSFHDEPRK
jgi:hypothetical protein